MYLYVLFWGAMVVQTERVLDTATPITGSHNLKTDPIQTLGGGAGLEFAGAALLRRVLVHLRARGRRRVRMGEWGHVTGAKCVRANKTVFSTRVECVKSRR